MNSRVSDYVWVAVYGSLTIVMAIGRFFKRIPVHIRVAIFGLIFLFGEIALFGGAIPLPRWASDWYTRPTFMKGCTGMSWDDKRVFDACLAAYERYQAHEHVGWRE